MKRKSFLSFLLVLVFIASFTLSGCGGSTPAPASSSAPAAVSSSAPAPASSSAPSAQKFVFRFGNIYAPDHPFNIGFKEWADTVKAKSNGRLEIQLFPASQLGNENDLSDAVAQNMVDMAILGFGVIGIRHAPLLVFDGPYTFRDVDHAVKVARGDIGKKLLGELEQKSKIKVLDVIYYGTRYTTTSKKAIKTPDDIKGLKIRVPNQPMSLAIVKSWGANPTPMAFAEVYLALQQGVVDGQENPMVSIMTMKFNEVQKFLSLTGHQLQTTPLAINADKFNSLPADLQKLLTDELRIAADKISKNVLADELKSIDAVKASKQMEVITPDIQAFRNAVKPVVEENKPKWGATLYDDIQAVK